MCRAYCARFPIKLFPWATLFSTTGIIIGLWLSYLIPDLGIQILAGINIALMMLLLLACVAFTCSGLPPGRPDVDDYADVTQQDLLDQARAGRRPVLPRTFSYNQIQCLSIVLAGLCLTAAIFLLRSRITSDQDNSSSSSTGSSSSS